MTVINPAAGFVARLSSGDTTKDMRLPNNEI
jgi:hypothetical protein